MTGWILWNLWNPRIFLWFGTHFSHSFAICSPLHLFPIHPRKPTRKFGHTQGKVRLGKRKQLASSTYIDHPLFDRQEAFWITILIINQEQNALLSSFYEAHRQVRIRQFSPGFPLCVQADDRQAGPIDQSWGDDAVRNRELKADVAEMNLRLDWKSQMSTTADANRKDRRRDRTKGIRKGLPTQMHACTFDKQSASEKEVRHKTGLNQTISALQEKRSKKLKKDKRTSKRISKNRS